MSRGKVADLNGTSLNVALFWNIDFETENAALPGNMIFPRGAVPEQFHCGIAVLFRIIDRGGLG